jgi:hypothetical protein
VTAQLHYVLVRTHYPGLLLHVHLHGVGSTSMRSGPWRPPRRAHISHRQGTGPPAAMLIAWLVSTDPYLAEVLTYAALTERRMRSWLQWLLPVVAMSINMGVLFVVL